MSSARSVGMNLARCFNAGIRVVGYPRRAATLESIFMRRYATRLGGGSFPGFERPG